MLISANYLRVSASYGNSQASFLACLELLIPSSALPTC